MMSIKVIILLGVILALIHESELKAKQKPNGEKKSLTMNILPHGEKRRPAKAGWHRSSKTTPRKRIQCVPTVPRMNLKLEKLLGIWFPVQLSKATLSLWNESFKRVHRAKAEKISADKCINLEFASTSENVTASDKIRFSIFQNTQSISVNAMLVGDTKHPKGSKWAIAWPSGEDTLTSVVAAGFIGKGRNPESEYNWLLTVDCDLNGIVESDWLVMTRDFQRDQRGGEGIGISNATINTILAILEGLHGVTLETAISLQPDHCHN